MTPTALAVAAALALAAVAPAALAQEGAAPTAELAEIPGPAAAEPHAHGGGEPHTHGEGEAHTHDDDGAEPHAHGGGEPHTHGEGEAHTHEGSAEPHEHGADEAGQARPAADGGVRGVVINEIEINPFGEDGFNTFEWIELYNPTPSTVDIGGWTVTAGVTQTATAVPSGVVLRPEQFFTFTRTGEWFANVAESATLRNVQGEVIDQTPSFIDVEDNLHTWQRKYDALDTDSRDDWHFAIYSRGFSNGKPDIDNAPETISIHVTTDREEYMPGETVMISGSVAGVRPASTTFYVPAHVKITVNGTDYSSVTSLTPGPDLKYATSIKLREALGTGLGEYDVVATYVGSTAATSFTVAGEEPEPAGPVLDLEGLALKTDEPSYLPGSTVRILAASSQAFALEGLEFDVIDPRGNVLEAGVLFPRSSIEPALEGFGSEPAGAEFSGTVYMSTVRPIYGSYSIVGNYGPLSASTAFALEEDVREDTDISLSPDMEVYGLGDTVKISGRVNKVWLETVTLEVTQIQNTAVIFDAADGSAPTPPAGGQAQNSTDAVRGPAGITNFSVKAALRPSTDGRFAHEFSIPNDPVRIGRYTVTASEGSLSASSSFRVAEDPASLPEGAFTVRTDSESYEVGSRIVVSGALGELDPLYQTAIVIIRLLREGASPADGLILSAAPDAAGNYYAANTIERGVFEPGAYDVTAMYMRGTVETVLGTVRETSTADGTIKSDTEYDFVGTYHRKTISGTPEHTATARITVSDARNLDGAHFTADLERTAYTFGDTVRLSGLTSHAVDIPSLEVAVLRPNGKSESSTVQVAQDGTYEWAWETPTERRDSNIGPYLLTVSSPNSALEMVFRVGEPGSSDEDAPPVAVDVEGDSHEHGSTVMITGKVKVAENRGTYSYPSSDRVRIVITEAGDPRTELSRVFVTPDRSGAFEASVRMTPGIYPEGAYAVAATYLSHRAHDTFYVGDPPEAAALAGASLADPSDVQSGPAEPPRRTVDERTADGPTSAISVAARDIGGTIMLPRSLSVTLRADGGDGASLTLAHGDGTCVVGAADGCLVTGPTRTPDSLYSTVSIGTFSFDVRYSGDGASPVRITVIPSERGGALPDSSWNVEASGTDAPPMHKVIYTAREAGS